jgi:hypothetical protein
VNPKKGDSVAPPTVGEEWRIRYCTNDAIKGWQDLETRAAENLRKAQGHLGRRHTRRTALATPADRSHRRRLKLER